MTDSAAGISVDAIPGALLERDQWVCWRSEERDGKQTKIPIVPGTGEFASTTDPATWRDVETALEFVDRERAAGIGFVFTEDDSIVGVDLDDCRVPETGTVTDDAADIIERLDSFTEISPSGTGFHILLEGDLPDGRNRKGDIELYDSARFFTVTGDRIPETPEHVAGRQDALTAIHREYIQADNDTDSSSAEAAQSTPATEQTPSRAGGGSASDLDDETLLQKARNASNGQKYTALWNGNTAGYESQSEADMALCCLLAFWTGEDATQMDRLFRESELFRPKWDEVHYADGATYGERTIERAITTISERYDPDSHDSSGEVREGTRESAANGGPPVDRDRVAYLEEKTQLLADQVAELEATVANRETQIADLEAERAALKSALADCRSTRESNPSATDASGNGIEELRAVWAALKRSLWND